MNWKFYAHVWLHGTVACWADDTISTYRDASVAVTISFKTFPVSKPASGVYIGSHMTPLKFEGENINVYKTDLWKYVLPLEPLPWYKNQPQWLVVRLHAEGKLTGLAHAMTKFQGGQLPLPYGTFCPGVVIQ